uniref:RHD domain-containing protein n=1 Tax=Neogobius melanostomus TaxID=47308 RepID=A0A8C6SXL7_9GOBI
MPTAWNPHPTHHGAFSMSMTPLPSLEWQLPSEMGQYKLHIQQHPKSYHRAHYETEGSRGAVKTSSGGHPEVQLSGYHGSSALSLQVFIGTADERLLKPHSFYQVHRVTGKTVTTPSMERIISGTKVLEILLEPKNNMRVMIDCVGILKLRNADIELRNGETDIGRKNTRVRLVFRVHIPEPGGQLVSLQVCSQPIECSQRAQEMPTVESQDLDRCSVHGGQQMVLTGLNFTIDSRVIFTERKQDGEQIWEAEATVDRDKTQSNMLFVEVPPYRDRRICRPVKVNFCVINGKKNMSQFQHFTFTPLIAIKAEPVDDYQVNYGYADNPAITGLPMKSLYHHHLDQDNSLQALGVSPTMYNHLSPVDTRFHGLLPDPMDPHYYQYRSCPALYHNQRSKNSPVLLSSSAHQAKLTVPCDANHEGDSLESFFLPKSRNQSSYETLVPLGRSPTSRYTQVCRQDPSCELLKQIHAGRGDQDETERSSVKQENISYAYLEDVNDIIRRDLKDHNVE